MKTRTKRLSAAMFLLTAFYVGFAFYVHPVKPNSTTCDNPLIAALAPWDSGCFYQAVYLDAATAGQVNYEKHKLDVFMRKGGFSHSVLWYRSIFFQKYREFLDLDYSDIHRAHWDYTRADPSRADIQIVYLSYLTSNELTGLAQQSLDQYCETYLDQRRDYLIPAMREVMQEKGVELSLQRCETAATRQR